MHAYTGSIATIWLYLTPIVGVSFFLSLLIRAYTLKRKTIKQGKESGTDKKVPEDVEAGARGNELNDSNEIDDEKNESNTRKELERVGNGNAAQNDISATNTAIDLHMQVSEKKL